MIGDPGLCESDVFEKDVLRVGDYWIAGKIWKVTRSVLSRLARNWLRAARRGCRFPVVWNHSCDARDRIGEITRLFVRGDVLFARFRVERPEDSARLQRVGEVSIEVRRPWVDGLGRRYDSMATHLGVVLLPVVPAQGPFEPIRRQPQGEPIMTNDSNAVATDAVDVTASRAESDDSWASLLSELNQRLEAAGAPALLPTNLEPAALFDRLFEILAQWPSLKSTHKSVAVSDEEEAELMQLRLEADRARRELAVERQRQMDHRLEVFSRAVDKLVSEGRIQPSERTALLEASAPAGYRLSLLEPFERLPAGSALPLRPIARASADPSPPRLTDRSPMTADRAAAVAQSFRRSTHS